MRIRRALAGLVLAGGSLLAAAPPAGADTPAGGWTSPRASGDEDGVPVAVVDEPARLRGTAEFPGGIAAVTFRLSEDAVDRPDDPCSAVATVPPQAQPGGSSRVDFAFEAVFPCNKRYQVEAVVQPVDRPLRDDDPLRLPLWIDVAIPPAPVAGLTAQRLPDPGRGTNLRWDSAAHEPDFVGFEIRRAVGGGDLQPIAEVGPGATSYADLDVPAAGGSVRYQVVGIRPGPGGSVVYSEAGPGVEVDVPAAERGQPGGEPVTGGSGGGGQGGGAQTVTRTYRPPSGAPRTTTTLDTGFQETLPFQPQAAPPSGDNAVVATIEDDGEGNRETMLLIAGGGVAFSWAMALRLLLRRAAPVL